MRNRSALEAKDKELKLILDTIMESVMILEDGKIVDLNPQAIKTFGLKNLEEGLGLTPLDFVPKYNHHIVLEGLKNPDTPPYQFDVLRRDGTIFPALIHGKNLLIDGKKLRVTSFIDISEIKETQKALALAKEKAEESTKIKSEFLANMSHEIRTPIHGILGMSHLALQENIDDKARKHIDNIHTSASSLLHIINDILDFSQLEAGKLSVIKIDFDMFKLIDSVLSAIEFKANEKHLELQMDYEEGLSKMFYGDPLRITQVLTNLIGNAVKFTEHGFIKLSVSQKAPQKIEFRVEDTGIGISSDIQEKLFDSFSQADNSATREYGGNGLGLSISKQLIELMDGKIWIESALDKGSTFTFEISLEEIEDKELPLKHLKDSVNSINEFSILLVEDNEINQEIFIALLEKSQIQIDLASNGKEALEILQKRNYNIIFMDLQMPVMGGLEATQIMRKRNITTPIIALSANVIESKITESLDAGMDAHLSKPIDIYKLYSTLLQYTKKNPKTFIRNAQEISVKIPEFQTLDTKSALSSLASSRQLYLKILKNFHKAYADFDVQNSKDDEFTRVMHTLKSLSQNIGSQELYALARKLEERRTPKETEKITRVIKNICEEINTLVDLQVTEKVYTKEVKEAKANILVVDDDQSSIDIVENVLHEYNITATNDATAVLELAKKSEFNLILLDIMMPDIDGYKLCWQLKKEDKTKDIPIIFLTGKTDENSIERAYTVGANDYVTKPLKPKELIVRINKEITHNALLKELEYKASYDVLTKVYNRRKFFELSNLRFNSSTNLFAIMIDIDYFKKINDNYGHSMGDIVLLSVAQTIQKSLSQNDIYGRIGGEEFAILIARDSVEEVEKLAETIRTSIAKCSVSDKGSNQIYCTISLGVAEKNQDTSSLDMLLHIADTALYEAKESGRNRTVFKL